MNGKEEDSSVVTPVVVGTMHPRIDALVRDYERRNLCLNRSPKTVAWYSSNLRLFIAFLKRKGHSMAAKQVTAADVRDFILYLREKQRYDGHPLTPGQSGKLSPRTVRAHVETLKAFFAWLHREGYVDDEVLSHLEFPKVPRKLKDVLAREEVERLLSSLDRKDLLGCRNSTILMMLLDTGLRCGELVSLKLTDTHVDKGYAKVMGKGARERIVPIGSTARKALAEYIKTARQKPSDSEVDNVFLSDEGLPLTVGAVQLMLKRLGRRCGIPRLHAHLCRHTFATNYLTNGGDLFTLQSVLGHSSLEMVRRYVQVAPGFVAEQHRRFSPLDCMSGKRQRHPIGFKEMSG